MTKFFCQSCNQEFEAEGRKLEYQDRLYGPCWKLVASCPICNTECDEVSRISSSKKSVDFDSYVEGLRSGGSGCCGGGGCCG